ncbi:Bromodomain-containing protein [Aspergillus multicolor]|uniref:putative transcription regulator BDF1 n=1 Tax=Aspergillus multicolor TaxID=41759 RepID=UPI003CCE4AB4
MATPPPEAPSILKEEKPQLPPSPNGDSSSDVGRAGVQPSVTDSTQITSINGTETIEKDAKDAKDATMNGHTLAQQNGAVAAATASPPKSPAPSTSATNTPHNEPAYASPAVDKKPVSTGNTAKQLPNGTDTGNNGSNEAPLSQSVSEGPSATPAGAQSPQSNAAVKTELPHHPHGGAQPDKPPTTDATAAIPSVQPSTAIDQEMRDAPASPAKLSREREIEPDEEPLAKRAKIDIQGVAPFKQPEPPTSAAKGSMHNGETSLTKPQHKFILKAIQSLKRMQDSRFFKEPVDPIKMAIPTYHDIIKEPMDLGTIERKLKNNEYSSCQRVMNDFDLMVRNAHVFNGPEHIVSIEGKRLQSFFEKQMLNLPRADEMDDKKLKKVASSKTSAARREARPSLGPNTARPTHGSPQATTFALGPEGLPLIRRDSTAQNDRPKRSIHPPKRDLPYSTKPKKKKFQWELRFCREVLDELQKSKHYSYAFPFYYPVDPVALNIPTYHSIIKKPMDLQTVNHKLTTGQYENAKEFELDIRQIVKNCFKFNLKGDPTYVAGERFEEVFNAKWSQKESYLAAHEPPPEQHSAGSSSEESGDDEEGSDDEEEEEINRLKQQIADMSQQLEAMTQKKKKTPPKKTKSKKKDSKKVGPTATGKKDKKGGAKSSKPEKARYVTYHDKQIISNGISSLPDKKMQEALKIIQSNVPALKVCYFRYQSPLVVHELTIKLGYTRD